MAPQNGAVKSAGGGGAAKIEPFAPGAGRADPAGGECRAQALDEIGI